MKRKSNYLPNFTWMARDLLENCKGDCIRAAVLGMATVFFQILSILFLWLFVRQLDGITEFAAIESEESILKRFRWAFFILGIVLAMVLENVFSYRSSIAAFNLWKKYTKLCSKRAMLILASFPLPGRVELNKFISGRNYLLLTSKYSLSMGIVSRLLVPSLVDIILIIIYSAIVIYISFLTFIVIVALSIVFVATMYRQNLITANLSKKAEDIAGEALKEKLLWIKGVQKTNTTVSDNFVGLNTLFEEGKTGKHSDTLVDSFASIKKGELYLNILATFSMGMALFIIFYYAYLGTVSWALLIIMIVVLKNLLSLGKKLGTSLTSLNRHYSQVSKYIRFAILTSTENQVKSLAEVNKESDKTVSLKTRKGQFAEIRRGEPVAIVGPWSIVARSMLFPLYGAEQTSSISAFPKSEKVLLCPSISELNTAAAIFEYFPMARNVSREGWKKTIAKYRYDHYEELPADLPAFLKSTEDELHPKMVSGIVLCLVTLSDYRMVIFDGRLWNRVWDSRITVFIRENSDKFLVTYYYYRWADIKKEREKVYLLMADELLSVVDNNWIKNNYEKLEEYMLEKKLIDFDEFEELE